MKNKWQASQVRAAQKWLADKWPELFADGRDLKPLALKIHKDVIQHADRPENISRRAIVEALNRHTRSFGYLFGLNKHNHRFNLSLEPVEEISEHHKERARQTLRRKQKLTQAARRKNASSRKLAPIADRSRPPRKKAETQISYKKTRRRFIIKPPVTAPGTDTVAA